MSQPSSFPTGCDGVAATGILYNNTAAEPYLLVNSTSPLNLIAAWQQNRWSDGGAQALGALARSLGFRAAGHVSSIIGGRP